MWAVCFVGHVLFVVVLGSCCGCFILFIGVWVAVVVVGGGFLCDMVALGSQWQHGGQ
jgi:hypothetical protein